MVIRFCKAALILFLCHCVLGHSPIYKLVTFNAALLYDQPNKNERLLALPTQLEDLDADVICLQEVFFLSDIIHIVEHLLHVFPYSYSSLDDQITPQNINQAPCSGGRFYITILCVLFRCNIFGPLETILTCAMYDCDIESTITQECTTCIAVSFPEAIFKECILFSASAVNIYGLVVLSKRPLVNTMTIPFLPTRKQFSSKAMIATGVEGIGTIACAHLTARIDINLETDPLTSDIFSSWEEQNAYESQFIIDTFRDFEKVILMGDFNSGPPNPFFNVAAFFPASYLKYRAAGFTSPYVELVGKQTFIGKNSIFDHVLQRGYTSVASKRIFIHNGLMVSLSDHYAVAVWLK